MEILIVLICLVILGYVLYTMFFKKAESTYDEMKPKLPQKERKESRDRKENKDREDNEDR